MAKQKQQAVETNEPLAGVTIRARKPRTVCPIKLQRQIGDAKDQFVDTFGTFEAAEDAWASVSQPGLAPQGGGDRQQSLR